jgi:hypothetical protein
MAPLSREDRCAPLASPPSAERAAHGCRSLLPSTRASSSGGFWRNPAPPLLVASSPTNRPIRFKTLLPAHRNQACQDAPAPASSVLRRRRPFPTARSIAPKGLGWRGRLNGRRTWDRAGLPHCGRRWNGRSHSCWSTHCPCCGRRLRSWGRSGSSQCSRL